MESFGYKDFLTEVLHTLTQQEVRAIIEWKDKEFFPEYAPSGGGGIENAVKIISRSVYSEGFAETVRKINDYCIENKY